MFPLSFGAIFPSKPLQMTGDGVFPVADLSSQIADRTGRIVTDHLFQLGFVDAMVVMIGEAEISLLELVEPVSDGGFRDGLLSQSVMDVLDGIDNGVLLEILEQDHGAELMKVEMDSVRHDKSENK